MFNNFAAENWSGRHFRWCDFVILLLFCLILICLPVLVTPTPPLGDYPNHLGRAHILAHWREVGVFREVFALDSLILPNVLTDIWIAALDRWIGALAAGQVVL